MRSQLILFFAFLCLLHQPALSVLEDEAYETDWHISLIGEPIPSSTFFHRPQADSPASLIYTVTDQNVLAAVHPRDGSLIWRQLLSDDESKKKPIVRPAEGKVITSVGKRVESWDGTEGRLIWERQLASDVEDVQVVSRGKEELEVVYVVTKGNEFVKLNGASGEVLKEYHLPNTGYSANRWLHVKANELWVVDLDYCEGTHQIKVHSIAAPEEGFTTKTVAKEAPNGVLYVGPPGILAWKEMDNKLRVNVLGGDAVATIYLKNDVEEINIHATPEHTTFLVHYQTPSMSWAEIFDVNLLEKIISESFPIKHKAITHTAFSSSVSPNGPVYYTWVLPSGSAEIYSSASPEPVAYIESNATNIPGISFMISEVINRADNTFALRVLLTSYPDKNTHLVRNGQLQWSRSDSLAGIKSATWVELLDPTTEEVGEELHVEETQSVLAAYIHRIKRHVHELVTYGPHWVKRLPGRILKEIVPGYDEKKGSAIGFEEGHEGGRWKDFFGFRKFVVAVTRMGAVVALDVGAKGKVVWSLDNLISKDASVKGIFEVGKGLVGLVTSNGQYHELDAFEGKVVTTIDLGTSTVKTTAVIDGPGERKSVLVIQEDGPKHHKARILPYDSPATKDTYLFIKSSGNKSVSGIKIPAGSTSSITTWTFTLPDREIISSLTTRPTYDPIASIGRVLGDRSVMYKYINPHLLAISALNPVDSSVSVYLLDSISGSLLHSATHTSVDIAKPTILTVCQNWLVYSYYSVESQNRGYTVVMSELYDSEFKNDRASGDNTTYSAFSPDSLLLKPHIISASYIFAAPILSLATTRTKLGITNHEILALLDNGVGVLSIPKRHLDPRRPIGREPTNEEKEEGLFRYQPVVEIDHRAILNHKRQLLASPPSGTPGKGGNGNDDTGLILTSPSSLESTSLVVVITPTDIFGTRVQPSGAFDLLGKGFNKLQLILTVLGLGLGTRLVAPMVRKKQINQRWGVS